MVDAFVMSRVDYCNLQFILWLTQTRNRQSATSSKLGSTLDFRNKKKEPYNYCYELHWLPVDAPIDFKILLLTYKILNDLAPNYLSSILARYQPARLLRTSNTCLLQVPTVSTVTYGQPFFPYYALTIWNRLTNFIKSYESISIFKARLKTFLFSSKYCI